MLTPSQETKQLRRLGGAPANQPHVYKVSNRVLTTDGGAGFPKVTESGSNNAKI